MTGLVLLLSGRVMVLKPPSGARVARARVEEPRQLLYAS
jgi:hypothetical protein